MKTLSFTTISKMLKTAIRWNDVVTFVYTLMLFGRVVLQDDEGGLCSYGVCSVT
ncbi:MAG: hypothetical protein HOE80_04960 [Candidatus Magasanikbacteria bacterium]|jgi:hypothetical protein|nr:hypothetical protein [Candidatus Magasanikbacteria bacterium]